jgi:hypothetical protein
MQQQECNNQSTSRAHANIEQNNSPLFSKGKRKTKKGKRHTCILSIEQRHFNPKIQGVTCMHVVTC